MESDISECGIQRGCKVKRAWWMPTSLCLILTIAVACSTTPSTSKAEPSATVAPVPTWTAAPVDAAPPTSPPIPSAAPFPGAFKLSVAAEPQMGVAPLQVRFEARLSGGMDDSYELYCPLVTWDFGDGQMMQEASFCGSWEPGIQIARRFVAEHSYEHSGSYPVHVTLAQAGLKLSAGVPTIEVR